MANIFSYQVLKDDTQHAVIKLTGEFDNSGQEENLSRITANTLYGAVDSSKANLLSSTANTGPLDYYGLTVTRLWYDVDSTGDVQLYWRANNDPAALANSGVPLMLLQGNGEYNNAGNWPSIKNPSVDANTNGDISICTRGHGANTGYTIIMELRKDNAHFQRGQLNDPAAFNYGAYGLTP
jgi:hypothetical protein